MFHVLLMRVACKAQGPLLLQCQFTSPLPSMFLNSLANCLENQIVFITAEGGGYESHLGVAVCGLC
jgi:hypothetical protein